MLQNNYSPKYSLLGASVVLLQTKSGTASFHGSVFEYFRNDDLNARYFTALFRGPIYSNEDLYSAGRGFWVLWPLGRTPKLCAGSMRRPGDPSMRKRRHFP